MSTRVIGSVNSRGRLATVGDTFATLIPSGTLMLFQQTAAPTGWTKQTTHNDKALRVVSGAAGSAGVTAFTTVFGAGKTTGAHTLSTPEMPSHSHAASAGNLVISSGSTAYTGGTLGSGGSIQNTGGGGSHNHTLSLDLQYVDLIIASKD